MSDPSNATIIVIQGKQMNSLKDFYCHEHLGGCGCVFRTTGPETLRDWEGDLISSYIICPNKECGVKIRVEESFDGVGRQITYRPIQR